MEYACNDQRVAASLNFEDNDVRQAAHDPFIGAGLPSRVTDVGKARQVFYRCKNARNDLVSCAGPISRDPRMYPFEIAEGLLIKYHSHEL